MRKLIVFGFAVLLIIYILTIYYSRPYIININDNHVISVYALNQSDCEFLIITKHNNKVIAELIYGPGIENTKILIGHDAVSYIYKHYGIRI